MAESPVTVLLLVVQVQVVVCGWKLVYLLVMERFLQTGTLNSHFYYYYVLLTDNSGSVTSSQCGSGGGGRVAVYVSNMIDFRGTMQARNGDTAADYRGAPGTVFVKTSTSSKLVIDPIGLTSTQATNLIFDNTTFTIDTMVIEHPVTIGLVPVTSRSTVSVSLQLIVTDVISTTGLGYAVITANSSLYVQGVVWNVAMKVMQLAQLNFLSSSLEAHYFTTSRVDLSATLDMYLYYFLN